MWIVLGDKPLGENAPVAVPDYGPGHWVLDKWLEGRYGFETAQKSKKEIEEQIKDDPHLKHSASPFDDLMKHKSVGAYLAGATLRNWPHSRDEPQQIEITDVLVADTGVLSVRGKLGELTALGEKWLNHRTKNDVVAALESNEMFRKEGISTDLLDDVTPATFELSRQYFCPDLSGQIPFAVEFEKAREFWIAYHGESAVTQMTANEIFDPKVLDLVASHSRTGDAPGDSQALVLTLTGPPCFSGTRGQVRT